MTPTETELLAPYVQITSDELVGETIAHTYCDEYTFIVVTESKKYVKIQPESAYDDISIDTPMLTVLDLKLLRLIDIETWGQILADRREKQSVRQASEAERTIARLVKECGVEKIRDLLPG